MARPRQLLSGDYWPPRERPDSYQPPTSYRLTTGITKRTKKQDQRHTPKSESSEIGRLSPESEEVVEGPTSGNLDERMDCLVQTTTHLKSRVQSMEAKIDRMSDKLDQILAFLGVKDLKEKSATETTLARQPVSQKITDGDVLVGGLASSRELAEALKAERQSHRKRNNLPRKNAERAPGDTTVVKPLLFTAKESSIEDPEVQGMRRSLKVVRRYLNSV